LKRTHIRRRNDSDNDDDNQPINDDNHEQHSNDEGVEGYAHRVDRVLSLFSHENIALCTLSDVR
jgi:hypothetical protein